MDNQGHKEVSEAVLIAAIYAIVTGFITWGFEETKKCIEKSKTKPVEEKPVDG